MDILSSLYTDRGKNSSVLWKRSMWVCCTKSNTTSVKTNRSHVMSVATTNPPNPDPTRGGGGEKLLEKLLFIRSPYEPFGLEVFIRTEVPLDLTKKLKERVGLGKVGTCGQM